MELREAKTAKVQAKADPSKTSEAVKEMAHVAAALVNMMVSLRKKEQEHKDKA